MSGKTAYAPQRAEDCLGPYVPESAKVPKGRMTPATALPPTGPQNQSVRSLRRRVTGVQLEPLGTTSLQPEKGGRDVVRLWEGNPIQVRSALMR